ncbi:MAG: heme lyase CcmF/NrfE family subunit [Bacteroidia bacterium]
MEINYIGELLWPGKLGNLFIVLSFVSALVASISYFFKAQNPLENSWQQIARSAFYLHSFSVVGIIATLFYLILNHRFEYHYVWQHSNSELPIRYMLSCFWEGQEGSFLLWTFWHVVLGLILMKRSGEWEAPVMTVFSLVQVFLASMLLGIWILDYKIGSNPFTLLREHPDFVNMPFTKMPNYLENLDGRGLNPLLQNYWMTIHPPTLFLGFASTLVPFAYAIAALWKEKYTEWLKPTLPWAFFSVMILGAGILMGGAWAYEALSFGGFWAWDPVENASLVPWLTLVGAAHVMLIQKNKGGSLLTTFFLTLITFIFILYSTFLTRSGVLGETSVHSFTDMGMSGQLLVYLLFFVFLSIFLVVKNLKKMPKQENEDNLWSREFWMFIGALVLFISSFQITVTTSIPVINKVLGTNFAPPLNPIDHYNSWQVPFAIVIALLIAVGQFFKYKKTDPKEFVRKITLSLAISLFASVAIAAALQLFNLNYVLLLLSSLFAVTANFDYMLRILKGKIRLAGASIAHIGFGLILLGALISTSKQEIISRNTSGVDISTLGEKFSNNDNIMLNLGDTLRMGDYFVTFTGKRKEGVNIYYEVQYFTQQKDGSYKYEFTLNPLVQTNPRMGNVAEPDTRHFLHKDIYTHVTYADLEQIEEKDKNEYLEPKEHKIQIGDTIFASNSIMVLKEITSQIDREKYDLKETDIAVKAKITLYDILNNTYQAEPIFMVKNNFVTPLAYEVNELGLKISFDKIDPETGELHFSVSEKRGNRSEFIIMKAIVFPFINVLWMGCILLVVGTVLAIIHRIKISK